MRRIHHVDRGISIRGRARYLWRGLAVVLGLIAADAFGAWRVPPGPKVRASATTYEATRVGPGSYAVGSGYTDAAGNVRAAVNYPLSVRNTAVSVATEAASTVGSVATAWAGMARGIAPAVVAFSIAEFLADQYGYTWDDFEEQYVQLAYTPFDNSTGTTTRWLARDHTKSWEQATIVGDKSVGTAFAIFQGEPPSNGGTLCVGHKNCVVNSSYYDCFFKKADGNQCGGTHPVYFQAHTACPAGTSWNSTIGACVAPSNWPKSAVPAAAVTEAVRQGIATDPQVAKDAWDDVGEDQTEVIPDATPAPPPFSGPSSADGETSTSTSSSPDGTTTTTTHRGYGFDYDTPGEVGVTDQETTTTTSPDGSTTTTTSNTTGTNAQTPTGTESGSGGAPAQSICPAGSTASGCMTLDDVQQTELPTDELDASLQVTPTNGSCPPPISITVMGHTLEFSWARTCEVGDAVNPLVRALAALSAGIWLIFMTRAR